tara:strand:+ start:13599 stop:14150 length:552 start_codon:yes stop_codon:yes gene_type:complete
MKKYVKEYKGYKVPDGASCFVESCGGYENHFGKTVNGVDYVFAVDNKKPEWVVISNILPLSSRPTIELPEASQEWMPEVGANCDAVWLELPDGGGNDFCAVTIKGYFGDDVWFSKVNGAGYSEVMKVTDCKFRPLKTQQEKDREAFIKLALKLGEQQFDKGISIDDVYGNMFDKGFTAPKAGD